MEIVFYNISNGEFTELQLLISEYNLVLKALLDKECTNKLKCIKEKRELEKKILQNVNDEKVIGILPESEYESIDKKFKDKYLGKNLLTADELEKMYLEIENESIDNCEKLKIIAKKALKNKAKAFFWIR